MPDPDDPQAMQQFINQMQQMFAGSGGDTPVNWDLAKQIALASLTTNQAGQGVMPMGFSIPGMEVETATTGGEDAPRPVGDPPVSAADRAAVADALRLADLWLEESSGLPSAMSGIESWTRSQWITSTLPIWKKLCDPVAARMVSAMGDLVPEEMREQLGPMANMVATLGGALFGGQLGQAMGSLAAEVLSAGDIGLPLGPAGTAALVPANITAYGEGLSQDPAEVRLYVALREAAHQRLFGHVPWLRSHVLSAVEAYASGIQVNRDAIEQAMSGIDPTNPESMSELALDGIFTPEDTPAQKAALARLETILALVEGWVCHVVDEAAGNRLPNVVALSEAFRRRRAAGGPAEQTFGALVGLELRPRRLREATAVWAALTEHRGIEGRDGLWDHPDLLPTADDFADPEAYAKSQLDLGSFEDMLKSFEASTSPDPDGSDSTALGDDGPTENGSGGPGDGGPEAPGESGETPGGPTDKP